MSDIKSILFVCVGNICRSPSAEAIMKKMASDRGVDLRIDSAGVTAYHVGERADSRMMTHAIKRGYDLTSISRAVRASDFQDFDMLIAMDDANVGDLQSYIVTAQDATKISKMTDYCQNMDFDSVPDPYYGGDLGFELVLDILEDACGGLLDILTDE